MTKSVKGSTLELSLVLKKIARDCLDNLPDLEVIIMMSNRLNLSLSQHEELLKICGYEAITVSGGEDEDRR